MRRGSPQPLLVEVTVLEIFFSCFITEALQVSCFNMAIKDESGKEWKIFLFLIQCVIPTYFDKILKFTMGIFIKMKKKIYTCETVVDFCIVLSLKKALNLNVFFIINRTKLPT